MNLNHYHLRPLQKTDFNDLNKAFGAKTVYKKSVSLWNDCLKFQEQNQRAIRVAQINHQVVGICTLKWLSDYPSFAVQNIPEINDLLVAPHHRNQGVGRALITALEEVARSNGYQQIGLAVGLYQDYGAAQKLYTHMGYIPDGRGITYAYQPVVPGHAYPVDDDLLLWFIRAL